MAKRKERAEQLTFDRLMGGRRKGAGRKKSPDSGVSHLKRETITKDTPVHVTWKLEPGLPSLRQPNEYSVAWGAIKAARERAGTSEDGWFALVHYSIQGDHLHLVVEAKDNDSLSRALNGLAVRLARGLNKLWGRVGSVFADRYHLRVLRTPRQVRNTLRYIFENARRHGLPRFRNRPDPFTSGLWFTGWKDYVHDGFLSWEGPMAQARSWLVREGWKRHGLLDLRPVWDINAA